MKMYSIRLDIYMKAHQCYTSDELDSFGEGYSFSDACDVARTLAAAGHRNVRICHLESGRIVAHVLEDGSIK